AKAGRGNDDGEDHREKKWRVGRHGLEDIDSDGARHQKTDERLPEEEWPARHLKRSLPDGKGKDDCSHHRADKERGWQPEHFKPDHKQGRDTEQEKPSRQAGVSKETTGGG